MSANVKSIKAKPTPSKKTNLNKKPQKIKTKTSSGGKIKDFFARLPGSFLVPIAVLSVSGLFLGLGSIISGNATSDPAKDFGSFIKNLGQPIFDILPLLFAAAVVITYTEEAGIAVFNVIIGYAVFSAIQTVFIKPVSNGFIILFDGPARRPDEIAKLVGSSIGITSLQTSVFGGIIVGVIVQWAYIRFHKIQLPQWLAFYGGKRFVAFPVIALMIPTAIIFLLLWPYIGFAFNWIGRNSGKIPFGFDSFLYGLIERVLLPFGFHHVFGTPLRLTEAGGNLQDLLNTYFEQGNTILPAQINELAEAIGGKAEMVNGIWQITGANIHGDGLITLKMVGVNSNTITFTRSGETVARTEPLFMFIQNELGLKLSRFGAGKNIFMQWGLPFAGLAMVMAAPKENRNLALGIVVPASVTSFVTGVTEPIEFTFLFLAPWMFFGFHAGMAAIAFWVTNLLSVHLPQSFSGNFIDFVLYGIAQFQKGTNFWWVLVFGAAYAPIYYFVFYFWIIKADLATPGRGAAQLFTKKDYVKQKAGGAKGALHQQALDIIEAYGGRNNITKTANCASRLRFDVKDGALVSEEQLKAAGVFGVKRVSPTHVQAIVGAKSESLKNAIDDILQNPEKFAPPANVQLEQAGSNTNNQLPIKKDEPTKPDQT